MHSLSKGYYNQKSFSSSSIFGSVPHLLGRPVGHVHVDDGGENGEDGAVGDHGAGGHLRSVAPILPFTPLLLTGPHLRVAKVLVDCLACNVVVTLGVFVLAMVERFLKNPAAGTTLVGMHILTSFW